jgi:hypothetical protein
MRHGFCLARQLWDSPCDAARLLTLSKDTADRSAGQEGTTELDVAASPDVIGQEKS